MRRRGPERYRSRKALAPRRRWRLIVFGALLLLAALGWAFSIVLQPAIHSRIVITTGADNGIYRGFAERYAPLLKRDGITLDIRSSSGSIENYERLTNPESEYEVGFIQSGTTDPAHSDGLQTI